MTPEAGHVHPVTTTNMEDTMCTRAEVQDIVDRLERELHNEFKHIRDERDARMVEIAQREITLAKDNIMKFVGWGGIASAFAFVYFFGGMSGEIEHLAEEQSQIQESLESLEAFMNRGDRFTVTDGNELKAYVDQQDQYTLRVVEDGFDNIAEQIDRLHKD